MEFQNTEVWGFEHALRGMRNPMNSWVKSDSKWEFVEDPSIINPNDEVKFVIGEKDMKLAQKLVRSGSEHRKFMRQIFVSVDITAPFYWWKEFDTYKVGTVANSTSTMHKIMSKEFIQDMFELEGIRGYKKEAKQFVPAYTDKETWKDYSNDYDFFMLIINKLNELRNEYLETKNKDVWYSLIKLLPESYLQRRTVTMNYENLLAICGKGQRRFHKLNEWSGIDNPHVPNFISWARTLPYARELIFIDEIED